MNISDIRIDTYTNMSQTKALRITHEPTGETVEGETDKSLHELKKSLIQKLSLKVDR